VDRAAWDAYGEELMALVGDDDPAEVQAATTGLIRDRIDLAGDHLRTRPEPHEWSVLELVGHLTDSEVFSAARYRWVLGHDEPDLLPYDQDLLADGLRHNEADPEAMVDTFAALRRGNLELWSRSTGEQRARVGLHAERGRLTYERLFRQTSGHDRFHLAQMDRTLAAVGRGAG
jgi:DinB superfamily